MAHMSCVFVSPAPVHTDDDDDDGDGNIINNNNNTINNV